MSNTLNINQFISAILITTFTDGLARIDLHSHLSWFNPELTTCPAPDYIVAYTSDGKAINCWGDNDTGIVLNDISQAFLDAGQQDGTTFFLSSDDYYLAFQQINGVIHFCITTCYPLEEELYTINPTNHIAYHNSGWMPVPQSLLNAASRGWHQGQQLSTTTSVQ